MENQKLEDCYYAHSSTIFSEMLGEDENYQRLKNAKIAAEKALQSVISQESWKQYLALDEICNELELSICVFLMEKHDARALTAPNIYGSQNFVAAAVLPTAFSTGVN